MDQLELENPDYNQFQPIGTGELISVYKARSKRTAGDVVIKICGDKDQPCLARLEQEARTLRKLAEGEARLGVCYWPRLVSSDVEYTIQGRRRLVEQFISGQPPSITSGISLQGELQALNIVRQYAEILGIVHGLGLSGFRHELCDFRWQDTSGSLKVVNWMETQADREHLIDDLHQTGRILYELLLDCVPSLAELREDRPLNRPQAWTHLSLGTRTLLRRLLFPGTPPCYPDAATVLIDIDRQVARLQPGAQAIATKLIEEYRDQRLDSAKDLNNMALDVDAAARASDQLDKGRLTSLTELLEKVMRCLWTITRDKANTQFEVKINNLDGRRVPDYRGAHEDLQRTLALEEMLPLVRVKTWHLWLVSKLGVEFLKTVASKARGKQPDDYQQAASELEELLNGSLSDLDADRYSNAVKQVAQKQFEQNEFGSYELMIEPITRGRLSTARAALNKSRVDFSKREQSVTSDPNEEVRYKEEVENLHNALEHEINVWELWAEAERYYLAGEFPEAQRLFKLVIFNVRQLPYAGLRRDMQIALDSCYHFSQKYQEVCQVCQSQEDAATILQHVKRLLSQCEFDGAASWLQLIVEDKSLGPELTGGIGSLCKITTSGAAILKSPAEGKISEEVVTQLSSLRDEIMQRRFADSVPEEWIEPVWTWLENKTADLRTQLIDALKQEPLADNRWAVLLLSKIKALRSDPQVNDSIDRAIKEIGPGWQQQYSELNEKFKASTNEDERTTIQSELSNLKQEVIRLYECSSVEIDSIKKLKYELSGLDLPEKSVFSPHIRVRDVYASTLTQSAVPPMQVLYQLSHRLVTESRQSSPEVATAKKEAAKKVLEAIIALKERGFEYDLAFHALEAINSSSELENVATRFG